MAAVLAFIPLTQSVFWGSMAFTLIGGTAVGTVLILVFTGALRHLVPRQADGGEHRDDDTGPGCPRPGDPPGAQRGRNRLGARRGACRSL